MTTERVIRMRWSAPQTRALKTPTTYVDIEGAIRGGKSTVGVWRAINLCQEHPGIQGMLSRWTGDALDAQLKPLFWATCPAELLDPVTPWNGKEEYVQFANGSRLYLRALKSSDEGSRYAKTAGLTLAFIIVDQPEEMPLDVYEYLKGRLSQKGYPHQLFLLPNPQERDHWISKEFPEDNSRADHEYIHFSTYDNRQNLGEEYIRQLESAYPPSHPMHRRLLLGLRGVTTLGTPVYGKIFKPGIHVGPVVLNPKQPVLESFDFAFRHPAVSWHQITANGSWRTRAELLGENEYLEDFLPRVLRRRAEIGIQAGQEVWTTCDPSGNVPTSHGTKKTAVTILQEAGIYPTIVPNANRPEVRQYAIGQIARLLLRLTADGPAWLVDPSCSNIVDGMTAGYVYPEKLVRGLQVPFKDGYYDHLQNTVEYAILAFLVPSDQLHAAIVTPEDADDAEDRMVRVRRQQRMTGRAGY